ncbi:MAG: hypothetical protein ACFCVD_21795 [Nodosilinea sp.]
MLPALEALFCPCCTPALLHALSQQSVHTLSQSLTLLGSGALSAAIGLGDAATSEAHLGAGSASEDGPRDGASARGAASP